MSGGADGDDARRCTPPEKSGEKVRQKKWSKVIDGKGLFKSINSERKLLLEHTGIMQEHIYAREPLDDLFAAGSHPRERREISLQSLDP